MTVEVAMEQAHNKKNAYLAGLIDADGSITIDLQKVKTEMRYKIKVHIYNCNETIMDYLINILGGGIKQSNNINKKHKKWRNCFTYTVQGERAIKLIYDILPFLIIKKRQALVAINANKIKNQFTVWEKRKNPNLKIKCYKELSNLKSQINKLNTKGIKKQFEKININLVPFNIEYLAGFCDADGCFTIGKAGNGFVGRIIVVNTDVNIINWINFHLGGNFTSHKRVQKNWNTSYSNSFSGFKAYKLATQLYPILLLKQKQAQLIIDLGKSKQSYSSSQNDKNKKIYIEERKKQAKLKELCNILNKRSI